MAALSCGPEMLTYWEYAALSVRRTALPLGVIRGFQRLFRFIARLHPSQKLRTIIPRRFARLAPDVSCQPAPISCPAFSPSHISLACPARFRVKTLTLWERRPRRDFSAAVRQKPSRRGRRSHRENLESAIRRWVARGRCSSKLNDGLRRPRRASAGARGVHRVRRSAAARGATPELAVSGRHSSIFWTSAPGGMSKLKSEGSRVTLNCGLMMSMRVSSP